MRLLFRSAALVEDNTAAPVKIRAATSHRTRLCLILAPAVAGTKLIL